VRASLGLRRHPRARRGDGGRLKWVSFLLYHIFLQDFLFGFSNYILSCANIEHFIVGVTHELNYAVVCTMSCTVKHLFSSKPEN
jgi:hypothetical protein